MEKQQLSSQINFLTRFGQIHCVVKRVEESESEGGIFITYQRTGVWSGPRTNATLSVLVWAFLVGVMTTVNCHGADGNVI